MRQTLSQSRSVTGVGGWVNGCSHGIGRGGGRGCRAMMWRWRGNRAPPARRFAAQGCSHICFGPVTPVPTRATALFVPHDIEVDAKRAARLCLRTHWPETDVGAALYCEAPRGRRSISAPPSPPRHSPEPNQNLSPFQPAPSSTRTGCCYAAGCDLPAASRQRNCGRHWKNAARKRTRTTSRSG